MSFYCFESINLLWKYVFMADGNADESFNVHYKCFHIFASIKNAPASSRRAWMDRNQ